ncbi:MULTISPECIES: enoyl-CoA hydratase [Mycobacterium]|uniref:Enoyl-CoA hydratase n=1 Tax=Mycobacterium kiyosense TaxID=2871094 RepID=A0A9P3UYX0_9MYCO|nr:MULTISPECIES: enoyl-CoA hydratase [Mycobacterium]BDE15997.1 enoyl-CoA hydratase [Mycobacterium sp. 20KCMC460]GLB81828.1 enoyl-CoA hydratase [Mycobacterium kiyosense]GLB91324.1 enoyl-CoA hydratase [Mycobacterium kiyosense]GLB97341.1 enoyl-CoA hydratase [Mycobacterium kiyosense]GLC02074.1 enoyl-CoA hydratase [Mycobacterium kiyosense]
MSDSGIASLAPVDGLQVKLTDGVLSVTIDRPDSLNSLITPVITGLANAMEAAATDPGVRVVRLGGAGRGFCSGAGISADDMSGDGGAPPDEIILEINRLIRAITTLPHPVVAVVQGPAAGVGVSIALSCDVVLASEKAFFMLAFTKIGLMPDGGASALIAAAIGRVRAMRMALLPERLTATEARDWGLVTEVYPAEKFDAEVDKVIARLLAGPAVAFGKTKAAINAATLTELDDALEREFRGQSGLLRAPDFKEGTKAFQEHRAPNFTDS